MKKKIQRPFSIEEWEKGAKIETRDGRQVRILCTNAKNDTGQIVGLIANLDGEKISSWYDDGHYFCSKDDLRDLVIVEEIEEPERWADNKDAIGEGWFINANSDIFHDNLPLNDACNRNVFATEKQAKSALAMARISQLMAHDKRYGGVVTDEEWRADYLLKYCIKRANDTIMYDTYSHSYQFLAFHTEKQRDLFLKENEQLVRNYLMID